MLSSLTINFTSMRYQNYPYGFKINMIFKLITVNGNFKLFFFFGTFSKIVSMSLKHTFTALLAAFDLRLVVSSSTNDGHLEAFFNDTWNRICYESSWKNEEATVVCRQLGLPDERAAVFSYDYSYSHILKPALLLDGIQCRGNEESLNQCLPSGLDVHSYYKGFCDEVGVVCTNSKILM